MRAGDIEKLISVGRPTIAPDGSFAVFATSRPDIEANRSVGQLWRVDLPGGSARRLTRGVADTAPRVSPDGAVIAFLRGDANSVSQVHVVAAAGGEPIQVTDAVAGVGEFAWSPDGTRLAYTARVPDPGRYGSVDAFHLAQENTFPPG